MCYTYTIAILTIFFILGSDVSRNRLSYVTILKIVATGLIFFALEFINRFHPSWAFLGGISCIILAPWLVSGDLFKKKK
jgi:hypothetical protein